MMSTSFEDTTRPEYYRHRPKTTLFVGHVYSLPYEPIATVNDHVIIPIDDGFTVENHRVLMTSAHDEDDSDGTSEHTRIIRLWRRFQQHHEQLRSPCAYL